MNKLNIKIGEFKANMYFINDKKYKETIITNIFFTELGIMYILKGQNIHRFISYNDYENLCLKKGEI